MELAYVNGDIMPIEDARVPIEDRGYQFGDAVYEYVASYNSRLFFLTQHMDRLTRSLRELSFSEDIRDGVERGIRQLFAAAGISRAGIYIQISRGVEPRNHDYTTGIPVQTVMTARPLPDVHPHAETGVPVITVPDIRWGRCDIKTVQLLPNVMAKHKALDRGVYDAVFVAENGVVREATSSNVFMVKHNRVITHPLTTNILPGITRQAIIDIGKSTATEIEERFYTREELLMADEVFLSGTTIDVLPVVNIDDKRIADGNVGSITQNIRRTLRKIIGA